MYLQPLLSLGAVLSELVPSLLTSAELQAATTVSRPSDMITSRWTSTLTAGPSDGDCL